MKNSQNSTLRKSNIIKMGKRFHLTKEDTQTDQYMKQYSTSLVKTKCKLKKSEKLLQTYQNVKLKKLTIQSYEDVK